MQVATSPGIETGFGRMADSPRIAWWAEDDRGNHYLWGLRTWRGGLDFSEGIIHYAAPLDDRATRGQRRFSHHPAVRIRPFHISLVPSDDVVSGVPRNLRPAPPDLGLAAELSLRRSDRLREYHYVDWPIVDATGIRLIA